MDNDSKDIKLVIKATNKASKVLDEVSNSTDKYAKSASNATKESVDNKKSIKDLGDEIGSLDLSMKELRSLDALISKFKYLKENASKSEKALELSTDAMKKQQAVVKESESSIERLNKSKLKSLSALDRLRIAKVKDNEAIIANKNNNRELTLQIKQETAELRKNQSALKALTAARKRISDRRAKEAKEIDSYSSKIKAAGLDVNQLDKHQKDLKQSIDKLSISMQKASASQKKYTSSFTNLNDAVSKNSKQVNKAADSMSLFGDESRKSMSVTQRLRGEVLSITAAYVGLYGVIDGIGEAYRSYNEEQAAYARFLGASEGDHLKAAKEMEFAAEQAERLGLDLAVLEKSYSKFFVSARKSGNGTQAIRSMFIGVAEAATVNKLSIDEQNRAYTAMIQIMSKGTVMAEELQGQLAEALPGAVALFAQSQEVGTAALRKMMEQGLLTSDQLLGFTNILSESVSLGLDKATTSFLASTNRLGNAVTRLRREFGEMTQQDVSASIIELTEALDGEKGVALVEKLADAFQAIVESGNFIVENLDDIITAVKVLISFQLTKWFIALAGAIWKMAIALKGGKKNLVMFAAEMAAFYAMYETLGVVTSNYDELAPSDDDISNIKTKTDRIKEVGNKFRDDMKKLQDELLTTSVGEDVFDFFDKMVGDGADLIVDRKIATYNRLSKELRKKFDEDIAALKDVGDGDGFDKDLEAKKRLENRRRRSDEKELAKLKSDLAAKVEKIQKSLDKGRADSLESELALIDKVNDKIIEDLLKVGMEKEAQVVRDSVAFEKNKIYKKYELKQEYEIAKIRESSQKTIKEFNELNHQAMRDSGEGLKASFTEIDEKYGSLIERLIDIGETEKAYRVLKLQDLATEKALDEELLRIEDEEKSAIKDQLDLGKQQYDQIMESFELRKLSINEVSRLRESGTSEDIAKANAIEQSIVDSDQAILKAIRSAIEFYESIGGEDAKRSISLLKGLEVSLEKVSNKLITTKQVNEELSGGLTDSFMEMGDGLADVFRGVDSLSGAFERAGKSFEDFAQGFLAKIAEMILKAAILRALSATPFGGMISGVINNAGGAVPTSANHSGGVVGTPSGMTRSVSPLAFSNAVKYHGGGIAGLRPNEVPTILERGEEVLTASDPRHRNNAAGKTVVNIIDQRESGSPEAEVSRDTDSNGMESINVLIRNSVSQSLGDGSLDKSFSQAYGAVRKGVTR